MLRVYLAVAFAAALIGAGLWIDHRGYERGKTACQAERAEAVEKVQTAIDLRDTRTAQTRVDMLDLLRVTIPPIEVKANESAERIRVVYRSIHADACMPDRPASVQAELDQARARTVAAIGRM